MSSSVDKAGVELIIIILPENVALKQVPEGRWRQQGHANRNCSLPSVFKTYCISIISMIAMLRWSAANI